MEKFIYVFSEADRDLLLNRGYSVVKADEPQHMYIFANSDELHFDLSDVHLAYSDTLTF